MMATIDLCIRGEIPKVKRIYPLNPRKAGVIYRDMSQENKCLFTPHIHIFSILFLCYTGLI